MLYYSLLSLLAIGVRGKAASERLLVLFILSHKIFENKLNISIHTLTFFPFESNAGKVLQYQSLNPMIQVNISLISLFLSILSLLALGVLLWQFRKLNKLKKVFFTDKENFDLEKPFLEFASGLKQLSEEQNALHARLADLEQRFGFAIQKIGVYRFNPFSESGGNFSFTLALLDSHDTGVIITSMHGREQNRIYSKNIKNGTSEIQLTEEENQALFSAKEKFKTKTGIG
jgi:hypothetical protein